MPRQGVPAAKQRAKLPEVFEVCLFSGLAQMGLAYDVVCGPDQVLQRLIINAQTVPELRQGVMGNPGCLHQRAITDTVLRLSAGDKFREFSAILRKRGAF